MLLIACRTSIGMLTPKTFDTLVVLVRNSGHLLEKDDLIRMLWPDSFVEEGSLSNNIFLLRKALGEDPAFIETVPRRGYRFTGAVRQLPPRCIETPRKTLNTDGSLAGSQQIARTINLAPDGKTFTSKFNVSILDVNGNSTGSACGTETATKALQS
jgi:DNA-binding winged helix-turn-helix (wHTH) protein